MKNDLYSLGLCVLLMQLCSVASDGKNDYCDELTSFYSGKKKHQKYDFREYTIKFKKDNQKNSPYSKKSNRKCVYDVKKWGKIKIKRNLDCLSGNVKCS